MCIYIYREREILLLLLLVLSLQSLSIIISLYISNNISIISSSRSVRLYIHAYTFTYIKHAYINTRIRKPYTYIRTYVHIHTPSSHQSRYMHSCTFAHAEIVGLVYIYVCVFT